MKKGIQLLILILCMNVFTLCGINAQIHWDQACSFNGTASSYIAVKSSSRLNITGSFSMEAWIKPVNSVSPGFQTIIQKRTSGATGYALSLTNGKVTIRTNNIVRLTGNVTVPSNVWTHVAGRYNISNGRFSIYINSVVDTSVDIASAEPNSNTDSLLIGKGNNNYFNGLMDNVRVWDEIITPTFLTRTYRSIITSNSGIYDSLVLSLPFQSANSSGSDFSIKDMTSYDHPTTNIGVTANPLNSRPSVTTTYNESVKLDGDNDYLSAPDNAVVSPTSKITLEAWVRPEYSSNSRIIISKGSGYNLTLEGHGFYFEVKAGINGAIFSSGEYIDENVWTHIAFTYDGTTGISKFFKNGIYVGTNLSSPSVITDNNDSLFIGGNAVGSCFMGCIDEVRISNTAKSETYINEYLFKNIEDGNDSAGYAEAVYNFDGYLSSSTDNGPKLHFRNSADFIHHSALEDQPISPVLRSLDFSNGYYLSNSWGNYIPSPGIRESSLQINLDDSITDINVFVALNHTNEKNLRLVLISPEGDSSAVFNQNEFASQEDNLVTVFDDQADSSVSNLNRYVAVNPKLKPLNPLNPVFTGKKTKGLWRLKIIDYYIEDEGQLYSWGIQFNNHIKKEKILSAKCYVEGFYNSAANLTLSDTVTCNLRNIFPPYSIVAGTKGVLKNTGDVTFVYNAEPVTASVNYYMQLQHRNSIETWSSGYFNMGQFSHTASMYDFTSDSVKVYEGNAKRVDNSPKKFAMFGGDVNQDGIVDVGDVTDVFNGANNFLSGYVVTDVTGDEYVDVTDLLLTYNNSNNFVSVISP